MSNNFYKQLPTFSRFSDYTDSSQYAELPADWSVVITDVINSTQSIEAGNYKEVNSIGVASIIAVLNAINPIEIPFVFGGDGATLCIPQTMSDQVKAALLATKLMAKNQFNLELRIGIVPISEVTELGYSVKVSKYSASDVYQQAVFCGGGLNYAEKLIKAKSSPYLILEDIKPNADFQGFECRWNEIPSPHGETLSLLVQAHGKNAEETLKTYQHVNQAIEQIYGNESDYCPVHENTLSLAFAPNKLRIESLIRTFIPFTQRHVIEKLYRLKMIITSLLGKYLMQFKIKTSDTDWGNYKKTFINNSDFQKFDEVLRMIISGTPEQHNKLEKYLTEERSKGKLSYGLHTSTHSLTTCIVFDYSHRHIHFLDGSTKPGDINST